MSMNCQGGDLHQQVDIDDLESCEGNHECQ